MSKLLIQKTQPIELQTDKETLQGMENGLQKIVSMFDTISPYEYLETVSKANVPNPYEIKLVDQFMYKNPISPGVINVILDFCFKQYKGLNKYVLYSIGYYFSRHEIKTVMSAMECIRSKKEEFSNLSK